jgi:hypothetical protein
MVNYNHDTPTHAPYVNLVGAKELFAKESVRINETFSLEKFEVYK